MLKYYELFPGVSSESTKKKVDIMYSLLTPVILEWIHAGCIARDNAAPSHPTCFVVCHEAAEKGILKAINQLMAVNVQGAGLRKLAQGRFDDSCRQMRNPSALDPPGVWNFQTPVRIPSLMDVPTSHWPSAIPSYLP